MTAQADAVTEAMGPALPPVSMRRELRERAGLSRRKAALLIPISHQTLGAWEQGRKRPTGVNRQRYAAFLRILAREAASRWLTWDDPPHPPHTEPSKTAYLTRGER